MFSFLEQSRDGIQREIKRMDREINKLESRRDILKLELDAKDKCPVIASHKPLHCFAAMS